MACSPVRLPPAPSDFLAILRTAGAGPRFSSSHFRCSIPPRPSLFAFQPSPPHPGVIRASKVFGMKRAGSVHLLSQGGPSKKKPCLEEHGSRQASREHGLPPKKSTLHARRLKRATSPDWHLREDEEQTHKDGKGPAAEFEGEASPFDSFENDFSDAEYECKEDGARPISLGRHPEINRIWESTEKYQEDCSEQYYNGESNSISPYFYSQTQYRLFWGEFINRPMQKSQWINWAYLDEFPHIKDLIQKFRVMGLHGLMGFRHNWHESIIRQFYATLEVDTQDEHLMWMTGKKKFATTFQEFASLIGLDYAEMKAGKSIKDLPIMQANETHIFYPTGKHQHGASQNFKRYPSLIFNMLRRTIMPKVGNIDAIRFPYYEVIIAIQSGDKLNFIEWMVARMIECRLDRRGALVFEPYIMALINHKTDILEADNVVHKAFLPFKNKRGVLEREDSPPAEVPPPVCTAVVEGASVWVPPEDYFVPYFATHLPDQLQESINSILKALDEKFMAHEQFLRVSFIDPMTAKVNSLADQIGRMATKEELGQLRAKVVTLVQATKQLQESLNTLYQHVRSCCAPGTCDLYLKFERSCLSKFKCCCPFCSR